MDLQSANRYKGGFLDPGRHAFNPYDDIWGDVVGKKVRIREKDGVPEEFAGKTGVIFSAYTENNIEGDPLEPKIVFVVSFEGKANRCYKWEDVDILSEADEAEETVHDAVNHPSHYTDGKYEVIDFIEAKGLDKNFYAANAVKYISRVGKKDPSKKKEDLQKAIWYLNRYSDRHETEPLGIDTLDYISDKGLQGTPLGIAIEMILEDEPEIAVRTLEMAINMEDTK